MEFIVEQDTRLLRNPQGTEGLLLEEAYCHLKTVNRIEDIFLSWGYLPSKTPAFDYYDVYKDYLSQNKELFRLFDRDGDLMVLRSDITLFLAKQLGMSLCDADLPVRIFYGDTILRHQGKTDISKNEFFQIGAELVGVPGMRGDAEVLALMTEVLDNIGVDYYCHIGSRAFYDLAVEGLDEEQKESAAFWIRSREYTKVVELLGSVMDAARADAIGQLFACIGDSAHFASLLESLKGKLSSAQAKALEYLVELMELTSKLDAAARFRLDLSEIGQRSYYTGISFSVYADGADSAVASGGRYDRLLEQYGFSSPSTGFSILLRKLEQLKGCEPIKQDAVEVNDEDPAEALKKAAEIRKKGRIAIL